MEFYILTRDIVTVKNELLPTRDISYNDHITLVHYNNGHYDVFIDNIELAINLGPLIMSIYTDPLGNTFALDSNGNNIDKRLVLNNSYTYPYLDASNNIVPGDIIITFSDGATFENSDLYETSFWYFIEGIGQPGLIQLT